MSPSPNSPSRVANAKGSRIERFENRELEYGFWTGACNKCDGYSKSPTEGGAQERKLAEQYDGWAKRIAAANPRTSAALNKVAEFYRRLARREDESTSLLGFVD